MKMKLRYQLVLPLLAILFIAACTTTAEKDINIGNRQTELSLADKVTYGRALETAIWAMPLMNMEAMRQAYRMQEYKTMISPIFQQVGSSFKMTILLLKT